MRRSLISAACAAALLSPVPLSVALAGTAAAQTDVSVVGMSQEQARTVLSDAGVPYIILNRSGSTMQNCRVTEQRDRGYDVEVEYDWNHEDGTWDKTEVEVWRGLALVIVCD
ncbi:Uncharacterised protein [Rhodococcus gordoniae]|uniref:Lipoprotein n=1 Tax=Rhodococcus gordoniae TaxID=223392 RepID=A0A379LWR4_9NOCA|nr:MULTISPECIES: hypothetical protein [Rhodococcus]SUE14477.1 Uncharacterised protein [Rhodococcus gordoniae]